MVTFRSLRGNRHKDTRGRWQNPFGIGIINVLGERTMGNINAQISKTEGHNTRTLVQVILN